ncbi:MAG: hypothetical protein LHV69_01470 [Elusimicrobia bacterium]|nr:hypothetical protein [Candidatus Obscuribacterium magneticum]
MNVNRVIFRNVIPGTLTLLLSLGAMSCRKKASTTAVAELPKPPIPVQAAPQPTPIKEKQIYVYSGDQYRDPFVPTGQSSNYKADAVFDPVRSVVKGIIFGRELKSAVLTGNAGSYFVKSGRIFDVMGKIIEGYTADIFVDKVVIQNEAGNTYELKVKNPDEEDKK